jgi:hypothetical protein
MLHPTMPEVKQALASAVLLSLTELIHTEFVISRVSRP